MPRRQKVVTSGSGSPQGLVVDLESETERSKNVAVKKVDVAGAQPFRLTHEAGRFELFQAATSIPVGWGTNPGTCSARHKTDDTGAELNQEVLAQELDQGE